MGGFNLPDFTRHRVKDKQTFSERQRQRRAQELSTSADGRTSSEGAISFHRHRTKDTLTFSERQRRRKGHSDGRLNLTEEEVLQGIDGLYTDTHIFPSPGGSPGRSPGASPGASPGGSPGDVRFNSANGRDALTLAGESQGEE